MEEERAALLALNAVPGLGPGAVRRLARAAGSARAVVTDPEPWALSMAAELRSWPAEALRDLAAREGQLLAACGARAIPWTDPEYPEELHHLHLPPPVLAVRGDAACLRRGLLRVAVVGARACTGYGRAQSARLGGGLAAAGAVVVSGAARGIDQAAMAGALEARGAVVAVLGSGLSRPYPPQARPLLDRIVEAGGAVISEFPCAMPPLRENFPRRNRVMAALARGVVVVQATARSGSMTTVDCALEIGRDVFAVPGPVDCIVSRGPHKLLREGAILAESAADILEHYGLDGVAGPDGTAAGGSPILRALAAGDRTLDELARELGHPVEALLQSLMDLELQGRAVRLPGGIYHRCGPQASAGPRGP